MMAVNPVTSYPALKWESGESRHMDDRVAEEVPVALIYNGISHAVMLASPLDLEDFAVGFSLSEEIAHSPSDIYGIEVIHQPQGIEVHIDLAGECFAALKQRRRTLAGRTGCGLCGAESLAQVMQGNRKVTAISEYISTNAILRAYQTIRSQQYLQSETGGTHACAWVSQAGDIYLLREDIGRHNALDKLIGSLTRNRPRQPGFVFTTSRASYEMVQKAISANISILAAISAPTGLAIRMAQNRGLTLVGFARDQQFVIYSHPQRILKKEAP